MILVRCTGNSGRFDIHWRWIGDRLILRQIPYEQQLRSHLAIDQRMNLFPGGLYEREEDGHDASKHSHQTSDNPLPKIV